MTGIGFLDLVIGMVFIYFLLSLIVSSIQEIRANIMKLRSGNLEKWFKDTLDQENLGEILLNHKLISGLVKHGRKPSYIPSESFIAALLDTINSRSNNGSTYDINTLKNAVENTPLLPDDLKRYVQQSISEASGELENVKRDIANWFDRCMDRVAGTYKNMQQIWLVSISFVVVAIFNADSISLSKYLYQNKEARIELANQAVSMAEDSTLSALTEKYLLPDSLNQSVAQQDSSVTAVVNNLKTSVEDIKKMSDVLRDASLPLGWTDKLPDNFQSWFLKITGLLISAFAVSLGTPFWFDTLNKLSNLRGAGGKPAIRK